MGSTVSLSAAAMAMGYRQVQGLFVLIKHARVSVDGGEAYREESRQGGRPRESVHVRGDDGASKERRGRRAMAGASSGRREDARCVRNRMEVEARGRIAGRELDGASGDGGGCVALRCE